MLLLVLFLLGVFLLFSIKAREFNLIKERERDFCVSERVQLLKPRERERKNLRIFMQQPIVRACARIRGNGAHRDANLYSMQSLQNNTRECVFRTSSSISSSFSLAIFFKVCVLCDEKRAYMNLFLANLEALFLCVCAMRKFRKFDPTTRKKKEKFLEHKQKIHTKKKKRKRKGTHIKHDTGFREERR